MVKESKTRPTLPRPKRDRKAPTRKKGGVSTEGLRDGRLVMRVQQSLNDLVDIRARERGESRSRFIERLLVAFLQADPRNPELDAWGRVLTDGPTLSKAHDAVRFGAAWAKFVALNESLLGFKPPDRWLDEPSDFVARQMGAYVADPDEDD
ncbi:hypothetical protein [Bradyrhizobium australafricanum]|uniref:hypothetical protein n=1 Tax=Bradyrhizobium australafricanum TaxID=2821406 RepID=UPI001CE31997|nr:hypothetical protein [Bradyrhizobium australafricanum]MCA6098169.1 hypothetical protein [Bradyrhizobium australafricanum]